MPIPGDVLIGSTVQYLPGPFDLFAYNMGEPGPVAALVTYINPTTQAVTLRVFGANRPPADRPEIPYYADIAADGSGFKRLADPETVTLPDEVTGATIVDTDPNNFRIEWINPAGSIGTRVRYRQTGDTEWLLPNTPGNLLGEFDDDDAFYFINALGGQSYDIQLQNLGDNYAYSAGVVETATTDAL